MAQFGVGCLQLLTCHQPEITARGSLQKTARLPNLFPTLENPPLRAMLRKIKQKEQHPTQSTHQVHPLDFEQDLYLAKLIEREAAQPLFLPACNAGLNHRPHFLG